MWIGSKRFINWVSVREPHTELRVSVAGEGDQASVMPIEETGPVSRPSTVGKGEGSAHNAPS